MHVAGLGNWKAIRIVGLFGAGRGRRWCGLEIPRGQHILGKCRLSLGCALLRVSQEGDKILLPTSAFEQLARLHIEYPMLFELRNPASNKVR